MPVPDVMFCIHLDPTNMAERGIVSNGLPRISRYSALACALERTLQPHFKDNNMEADSHGVRSLYPIGIRKRCHRSALMVVRTTTSYWLPTTHRKLGTS